MFVSLIVGYFMADLLAGFWHWVEDRYFETEWPLIGKYIAKPNELHHSQPAAFLDQGYLKRNWTTLVPALIGFAIALDCHAPLWVLAMFAFVSQANEIHAWAHRGRLQTRLGRVIRGLQELGIMQSPKHHGVHHKAPFDCRYCVMSDWLNPLLDWTGFWPAMEWAVARVLRIHPKA